MPSGRYYWQQAMALLSWADATADEARAKTLRERAARELARAGEDKNAITDLNRVLSEFNDQQMRQGGTH